MEKTLKITKDSCYFLFVFLLIYCSHDTLLFGTNADNRFILIRKALPFALIAMLLVLQQVYRIRRTDFYLCALVILLPVLSCVANREEANNYIYRAAIMICALLLVLAARERDFYRIYNRILYSLSIWSIATYLLMLLAPGIVARFPAVHNTEGVAYYFLGFSTMNSQLHYGMVRNASLFREPGMFCVMLTLAMVIEIAVLKRFRGRYILVFTAAMVTTFSTAGYIILAVLYLYYLFAVKHAKYKGRYLVMILLAVAVLATQTDLLSMEGAVFDKFVKGSNSYGSWLARLRSLTESVMITLENPLFGIGRYALYDAVLGKTGVYRAVDNTNTILVGFAAYGILFGLVLTWGLWRFARKNSDTLISALWLFLILLLALSNEDLGQNILFYYLVFDGICGIRRAGETAPAGQAAPPATE